MIDDDALHDLANASSFIGGFVWESVVEGRDQQSGASFIQIGIDGVDRQVDLYLSVDGRGADARMHDLVAAIGNYASALASELVSAQHGIEDRHVSDATVRQLRSLDALNHSQSWEAVETVLDGRLVTVIEIMEAGASSRQMTVKRDLEFADSVLVTHLAIARNNLPELLDLVEAARSI